MSQEPVRYECNEKVAVIQLDDGKANALSPERIDEIHRALDRAEKEAGALVIAGRPGRFCAGFDLQVMGQGGDAVVGLVRAGAELALRVYGFPTPVVGACTGHALAMGAILLLAMDTRIGAEGEFKIGLNEVAIGLTLPAFGVEFARERLSKRHFGRAALQSEIYDAAGATDAGFLDRAVAPDAVVETARAEAARLQAGLDATAYRNTKGLLRRDAIERIRATLAGMGDITRGG